MIRGRTADGSTAGPPPWGLLVKDSVILSCRRGDEWWTLFRHRFEPLGRVASVPGTASPQGDHAWVRCEDPFGEDVSDQATLRAAECLRDQMVEEGIPQRALRVQRLPKELRAAVVAPGRGE